MARLLPQRRALAQLLVFEFICLLCFAGSVDAFRTIRNSDSKQSCDHPESQNHGNPRQTQNLVFAYKQRTRSRQGSIHVSAEYDISENAIRLSQRRR